MRGHVRDLARRGTNKVALSVMQRALPSVSSPIDRTLGLGLIAALRMNRHGSAYFQEAVVYTHPYSRAQSGFPRIARDAPCALPEWSARRMPWQHRSVCNRFFRVNVNKRVRALLH